jgi:hypothetical protein
MSVENPSPVQKNYRHFIWSFVGMLSGVFLGILISLNRSTAENRGNYTLEFDNNGAGKSDTTLHYERGVIARAEHDRNFDGMPDYWEWYKDGIASHGETDSPKT